MDSNKDDERRSQIAKVFGKNLLKFRKQKGFTREELAEQSNLSANYIYGLENGTYLPGCLALIDLSNALDITPTELLGSFISNKTNTFIEKFSENIDKLSEKDLRLILNIIDFFIKNNE